MIYKINDKEFNLSMKTICSVLMLILLPLVAIADDKRVELIINQIKQYEYGINHSNVGYIMNLYRHDSVAL